MCGATSQMKDIAASQQQNYNTMTNEASQVFGQSSQIFNDLQSSFAPILAAGPGQQGFTPAELSNLQSQAVTQGGIATRNAQQAAGEQAAAQGGGTTVLPSGAELGMNANIAEAGASNTANALSNINLQSDQLGQQNWMNAAGVLAGAPNVFNAATGEENAATGSGNTASQSAGNVGQVNSEYFGASLGAAGQAAAAVGQAL